MSLMLQLLLFMVSIANDKISNVFDIKGVF